MHALHYAELETWIERSGIGSSIEHQRRALESTGIECTQTPWVRNGNASMFSTVLEQSRVLADVDLVHCNTIGPSAGALIRYARYRGIPTIAHAHVTREDFAESFRWSGRIGRPLQWYLRWFYSQPDLVLCPSEYTRSVLESYPVRAPIRTITNGVDFSSLEGFESLRDEYRERYDLSGTVVFAVGNVFERKGLSTFCQLARDTERDFVWFGPYDTGPHAGTEVRYWTNNPPDNLQFTGWIEDKRGAFAAGDVFCFPTKEENQGISVLEAMACGKAVVLRDIPVFDEFYTDGVDCLKCQTCQEFREAIDTLADEPELRRRLGENAKETAAEHGLDRVGEELASIYRELVSGAKLS